MVEKVQVAHVPSQPSGFLPSSLLTIEGLIIQPLEISGML